MVAGLSIATVAAFSTVAHAQTSGLKPPRAGCKPADINNPPGTELVTTLDKHGINHYWACPAAKPDFATGYQGFGNSAGYGSNYFGGIGIGGNLALGQSSNTYGDFPSFDGNGWGAGVYSYARFNLPNGWFAGPEIGGMSLRVNGSTPDGVFGNIRSLLYEGGQVGYDFNRVGALPSVKVYAGLDASQSKYNVGVDTRSFFESMSGTLQGWSAHTGAEFAIPGSGGAWFGFDYRFAHQQGHIGDDPVKGDVHLFSVTGGYQFPVGR